MEAESKIKTIVYSCIAIVDIIPLTLLGIAAFDRNQAYVNVMGSFELLLFMIVGSLILLVVLAIIGSFCNDNSKTAIMVLKETSIALIYNLIIEGTIFGILFCIIIF